MARHACKPDSEPIRRQKIPELLWPGLLGHLHKMLLSIYALGLSGSTLSTDQPMYLTVYSKLRELPYGSHVHVVLGAVGFDSSITRGLVERSARQVT